jgi:translation initiation factor 2B subunit (eIF-2B alpha/beta/delta family)
MYQLQKSIELIKEDNQSGSSDILHQTIQAICLYLKGTDEDEAEIRKKVSESLKELLVSFGSMSVLFHFANHLLLAMDQPLKSLKLNRHLLEVIRNYEMDWEDVPQRLAHNAYKFIDFQQKTVLLHSNSSALGHLFSYLKKQEIPVNIIQTESRPAYEGRTLARQLADLGYQIKLITDSNISRYMDQVDMAIVGADSISEDHFINKTGTYLTALACQHFKIPFYVLADSRKLIPKSAHFPFRESPKPDKEILEVPHPNIEAENYYFEEISNGLVTAFILENHVLEGHKISELLQQSEVSAHLV